MRSGADPGGLSERMVNRVEGQDVVAPRARLSPTSESCTNRGAAENAAPGIAA